MNQGIVKPGRDFAIDSLHIFVLCGFAVAQPLLDLMGRTAEFFVVRRSQPIDIVLLVLLVCVLLPALVVLVEAAAGRVGPRVRKAVHGMIVASLVAAIALPALKRLDGIPGVYLVAGATLLGVALSVTYLRFASLRFYLTVLSPAVLIFPGLFLFYSPLSKVVFPPPQSEAAYPKVDATAPIVMVIFDELPVTSLMDERRRIDPIRYPNFAALAQDATWFRNATTVSDGTIRAVLAILTGTYSQNSRLPTATDHPRNIFSLLGETYQVVAHEPVTQLCPDQVCGKNREGLARRLDLLLSDLSMVYLHIILPRDLTFPLPPITQKWGDFANREISAANPKAGNRSRRRKKNLSEQFMDFVSTIHSAEKPTLYFLHIGLPHAPYSYLPSGKRYSTRAQNLIRQGGQGNHWGKWRDDEWAVVQGHQGHLLQVGFVDTLLGRLLARLKKVGLYDRSLIVITADHGVSFRKGDSRRGVTKANYQDILPVPLLVKAPSQRDAMIDDRNVETIDILPLMADILDVRLPWPVDGDSPLDPSAGERHQKRAIASRGERTLFISSVVESRKYLTLKRKLALFGPGNHLDGLLKIGPNSKLVGRNVKDLKVSKKGTVTISLDNPHHFLNVKPTSDFIPALVTGRLRSASDVEANLNLAIAINGTIKATTRTYTLPGVLPGKNKLHCWSAVVDERSFHPGRNDVEVFVLRSSSGKAILEPTKETTKPIVNSDYRNVVLGNRRVLGIRDSGFHGTGGGGKARRWTNGAAKLVVPIDENSPPKALRVDLAFTGPQGTELKVLLNGDVLFHESLPPSRWSKTFSLAGRSFNQQLTIELLSDTFVPRETTKGSVDPRTLGVMVKAITLLESDPVDSLAEVAPGK